jgi:aryl-alcohol dehydrogenase-like predicted oxidoreductase
MNPLNLAGIDQPLTPVILRTMTFGDSVAEPAAAPLVEDFLAAGGTGIDTANGYADGHSESILARLLRDHRDQVVLATKGGIPRPDADDAPPPSVQGIRRCVAGSLHRLDTDHVDLLYLHQPDRATPIGQTLTALQELLDNGDIRTWGVSNFAAWQIAELRYQAADLVIPTR